MFNHAERATMGWTDEPVRAPLDAGWAERAYAHFAGAKKAPLLILDAQGLRLVDRDTELSDLAAAIADPDGTLNRGVALSEQVRALGPVGERPRYVRLRFDPRGIAAPALCWVTRMTQGDASVIVIGVLDRVPHRRKAAPPPPETVTEAVPDAETVAAPRDPRAERLVWRSDALGRLNSVTGNLPGLVATLRGRLWSSFPDGGVEILAALRERRTFRALPLIVRDDESGAPIALSVSGAPLSRNGASESVWSGFVALRDLPIPAGDALEQEAAEALSPQQEADPSGDPIGADLIQAGEPGAPPHQPALAAEPEPGAASGAVQDLLSHERDAFREIARTLGALLQDAEPAGPRFRQDEQAPGVGITIAAVLESLPAGVLVSRGQEVLFVNRRLSDLIGLGEGGVAGDEGSLSPLLAQPDGERLVTVPGAPAGLMIERASIDWEGSPASLVLARPAPAVFRWFGPASSEGGGRFADVAHASAMLGPSGEGRGAIDPRGRVLVIKQAPARAARPAGASYGAASAAVGARRTAASAFAGGGRSTGAVVALRQRVERLLAAEEAPDPAPVEEEARRPDGAVVEQPRAGEDAAWRRFAFFLTIGQALRGSLRTIRETADDLLGQTPRSEAAPNRDRIREMQAASVEAANLLDGLLAWTLVASGRADRNRQSARLNAVVGDCIAGFQGQAAAGRVLLRTSLSDGVAVIGIDELSLSRTACNAIAHAIEQSRPGGQVIVSTVMAENGQALLRVRSTGFEMDSETIARALDPAGEADAAAVQGQQGLLGLMLAKALAEVNGGRFAISSRAGEGTLVEIGFRSGAPGGA